MDHLRSELSDLVFLTGEVVICRLKEKSSDIAFLDDFARDTSCDFMKIAFYRHVNKVKSMVFLEGNSP